jgi:hypothetical protein
MVNGHKEEAPMLAAIAMQTDGTKITIHGRTTPDLEREADRIGAKWYRIDLGTWSETIVRVRGEWIVFA